MITTNRKEILFLNRVNATVLLVRLETADIPYPYSKKFREQLIHFLLSVLTDEDRNGVILRVKVQELEEIVEDIDSALKVIKDYCEV